MESKQNQISKLVSLTFDESPRVRREAAKSLGEMDDPAAIFALVELSYDKDISVKRTVQEILDRKKKDQQEVMSFADIFSSQNEAPVEELPAEFEQKKEKILSPITQMFEKKLGKAKAEIVKNRMMPAIEKVYAKTVAAGKQKDSETGKKAMQEFLTSYLESISGLESIESGGEETDTDTHVKSSEVIRETGTIQQQLTAEIGEIGTKDVGHISEEIMEMESEEAAEERGDREIAKLPDTLFKRAYEVMMLSGGDEKIMRREMKDILKQLEKDVKMAYVLAKKKFRETRVTHLTKLKHGMRNLNTETLVVKEVAPIEYIKGKTKKTGFRIVAADSSEAEGVIYMTDERANWLKPGMKLKIVKGIVRTFSNSGETVIMLGKNGNINIVI